MFNKINAITQYLFSILALSTLLVSTAVADSGCEWKKTAKERLVDPDLVHIKWECQREPYGDYDKISLHRIRNPRYQRSHPHANSNVILFLPGTWEAAGWSGIRDTAFNPYLRLADMGVDVWLIGFRNSFLPNLAYNQFADMGIDISDTADWTYGVYREDIKTCVKRIQRMTGVSKINLAGFSRGVYLMHIYASAYPEDLSGLVVLDGPIFKNSPMPNIALDETEFDQLVALFKAGQLPSDGCQGFTCPPAGENYRLVSEAFLEHYNDIQLASRVPEARVRAGQALPEPFTSLSDYLADYLQNLWGNGIFTNVQAESIPRDVLIQASAEFSRYWPVIQDFESMQMMAWEDVPYLDYDDNTIDLPCIAFLSGLFCPGGKCLNAPQPRINQTSDMTIHYLEGYGHLDIMFGGDTGVAELLHEWLDLH